MKDLVTDKWGNTIYLTDERWQHIIARHPEMIGRRKQLLMTLQAGERIENPIGSKKFNYWKRFRNLRPGKTKIRAIVQFELKRTKNLIEPNNFVVTAYQI